MSWFSKPKETSKKKKTQVKESAKQLHRMNKELIRRLERDHK